jgi:hypothetical protein
MRTSDRPLGKFVVAFAVAAMTSAAAASPVAAIPSLQLYVEGARYESASETWEMKEETFRLWVLGNVEAAGAITDMKLTAAFSGAFDGTITLTPALANPAFLTGPTPDASVPSAAVLVTAPDSAATASGACGDNGTSGTIPCRGDWKVLAPHGEYGPGIQWKEWSLGDFTLTDSPIGDFITALPTGFPRLGQINAYDVSVSGFPVDATVHFDAFGLIGTQSVFAPFSHDAAWVPWPATGLLVASGAGLLVVRSSRRRRAAPRPSA